MPFSLPVLIVFLLALGVLFAFVQYEILVIAFDKLGLSHESALLLLLASLFGSAVNLPLFKVRSQALHPVELPSQWRSLLRHVVKPFEGITTVAVNVGGCLVPMAFSLYLIAYSNVSIEEVLIAVAVITGFSYFFSRPIPGLGIGIPILIAPVAAALVGLLLSDTHSAALAYIGGTLGVLIGADILKLKEVRYMGAPVASIGGAGTFDGIYITGVIAVLLA